MPRRPGLLVITAAMFVAWIGYLAFLAATTTRPVVLRRPQFLESNLDVIAELTARDSAPDDRVRVLHIHWPPHGRENLTGKEIRVDNLDECKDHGWVGPGKYILPLVEEGKSYRVASVPRSPGFNPFSRSGGPWIYPLTAQTEHQLEHVPKAVEASR